MKNTKQKNLRLWIICLTPIILAVFGYIVYKKGQDSVKNISIVKDAEQVQQPHIEVKSTDSSKADVNAPNFQQKNEVKGNQTNEFVGRDKKVTSTIIHNPPPAPDTTPDIKIEGGVKNLNTGAGGRAGDDYYVTEPTLNQNDINYSLHYIDSFANANSYIKKDVIVVVTNNGSQKVAEQIGNALKEAGYKVSFGTEFISVMIKEAINVNIEEGIMKVRIFPL